MQSQSVLANLTPLFAVVTLPAGILAALFVSLPAALTVFVVGWLLLTPASAILFGPPTPGPTWADDEVQELVQERTKEQMRESMGDSVEGGASADPVEELRDRYARGEIDEVELERRLDALLETENVDSDDEESIERAKRNIDTGERAEEPAPSGESRDARSATDDTELAADRE